MLTREQILKADDLPREAVPVPEWGGSVLVRTLTGSERDGFEKSIQEKRGKSREANLANIRAKLAALCVVGEDGKRLFSDLDAEALGRKSAKALDRVFSAATKLNGITEDDVEELAKNSEAAPAPASGSS